MKRKIASRKLKRTCIRCNKSFVKSNVYYLKRTVFNFLEEIVVHEYILCPRCKYESERKKDRYENFVESGKCHHPIREMVYTTMAGEDYVQEPSHTECCICGGVV